jgi:hypothetical protein
MQSISRYVFLDYLTFITVNIIFSIADIGGAVILFFNSFFIHRFALINHYMQHYSHKSLSYKITSSCLLLDDNARLYHLDHHLYFNGEKDVDYSIYNPRGSIYLHIFKLCTLQYFIFRRKNKDGKKSYQHIIICQSILFLIFYVVYKSWYAYIIYYFLPLLVAKIINDLRVLVEHYDPVSRTGCFKDLNGIPLLNYFISPYGFDDHRAHHEKPNRGELSLTKISFQKNHITELMRILRYG